MAHLCFGWQRVVGCRALPLQFFRGQIHIAQVPNLLDFYFGKVVGWRGRAIRTTTFVGGGLTASVVCTRRQRRYDFAKKNMARLTK